MYIRDSPKNAYKVIRVAGDQDQILTLNLCQLFQKLTLVKLYKILLLRYINNLCNEKQRYSKDSHNDPKFSDRHVWQTGQTQIKGAVWSGSSLFAIQLFHTIL